MDGQDTGGPVPDRAEARAVTALAVRAAAAYGRPDLAAELGLAADRLADPGARVLVVGDFKQGKSALVSQLAGTPVCPVHDDVATRLPTVVRHGSEPAAVLVGPGDDDEVRRRVGTTELTAAVTGRGLDGTAWTHAEVELSDGLVADGLVLVDTPGEGGPRSARGLAVRAGFPAAHAVVVVTDASRELTAPELALLRAADRQCAVVVLALTKTDLHPRWREVRDLDLRHLRAHELDRVRVLPVSATLAAHARRVADDDLLAESGVPALADLLRTEVADPTGAAHTVAVLDQVAEAVTEVAAALEAERVGLEDPERAAEMAAELTAARDRAAELKERSARWQQTLSDGVSDLVSDIDWDLRDRIRHVVRAGEEALEQADPASTWDTFAPWFTDEVAEGVTTTFIWAGERTWRLAERVAEHFALSGGSVRSHLPGAAGAAGSSGSSGSSALVAPAPPESPLEQTMPGGMVVRAELPEVPGLDLPDLERIGWANGFVVGMRGSYGGVLMVGMVTTLSGLALINPFSVGAGVLLGTKTIRDERKRALQRRRAEAKQAVRRHGDEVLHLASKRSRDLLRDVQRTLRDHFTAQAESLARSVAEAVTAAAAAQEIESGRRERRLRDVKAELARVELLAGRIGTCRAGFVAARRAGDPRPGAAPAPHDRALTGSGVR